MNLPHCLAVPSTWSASVAASCNPAGVNMWSEMFSQNASCSCQSFNYGSFLCRSVFNTSVDKPLLSLQRLDVADLLRTFQAAKVFPRTVPKSKVLDQYLLRFC